jgi:prepilin-type N-terminal cleavage/methylation domain-containing protein/prepilin-type processing-associated H-X9-DG protein
MTRRSQRPGFSLIELLVVVCIIAILLALLLAGVQRARLAAAKVYCVNNLKQIGIALGGYHSLKGKFPFGYSTSSNTTWLAEILPYIEQTNVQRLGGGAAGVVVKYYICPSDTRNLVGGYESQDGWVGGGGTFYEAFTDYNGVNGTNVLTKDGMLYINSAVRQVDVTDGLNNTVMVGERPPSADLVMGWWYNGCGQWVPPLGGVSGSGDVNTGVQELLFHPQGLPEMDVCPTGPYAYGPGNLTNNCDTFHFWSLHQLGCNWLFADGSVRFIPYTGASVLPSLATRAGNDTVAYPY